MDELRQAQGRLITFVKKGGQEARATLFVTEKTLDNQLFFSGMLQVVAVAAAAAGPSK